METPQDSRTLSKGSQMAIVAVIAGMAAIGTLLLFLSAGSGQPPSGEARIARFVPSNQQKSTMQFQTVHSRYFQTVTITDGYVAPSGSWTQTTGRSSAAKDATPVLQGQSADVIQAEGDLATARAQLVAATTNEHRQHALYAADAAALKDWQQAETDLTTAASAVSAARNKLRLLGKSDQDILALEGVDARSPGRIFSLSNNDLVWLVANVREADAPHVHIGDKVRVNIPALEHRRKIDATISYISNVIDPTTHRLAVAARYKNPGRVLAPNMLATFEIFDGAGSEAPSVPENAVIYEGEISHVWVVQPVGDFVLRTVSIGRTNDGYAEVTRGLSAGEKIVTGGALFLDQDAPSK